jgi:hypothetical protein
MSVIDPLGWVVVGICVLFAIVRVLPSREPRVGRKHGAHEKPPEPESAKNRHEAWHEFRYAMVMGGTLAFALLSYGKHDRAAQVIGVTGACLGIWEIVAWLKLTEPADRAHAVSGLRILVSSALAEVGISFGGWHQPTTRWLLVLSLVIIAMPRLDSAFKAYVRRKSGGSQSAGAP